ncbi:MAG: sigma-54-dependent Fis family transcriptional regulator, partial [Candidatus Rokubacteria bacterium]|nr:sigma-54-dependent Fis family transcriptional regulator [Candidatus Rokubacteria bacterium]
VDVRLPDGQGTDLLEQLQHRPQRPLVVIMTGFGSVESAVECMRSGAFDYLIKPFSTDQLEVTLKKADQHLQLVKVNQYLSHEDVGESGDELLGKSPALERLRLLIRKVAPTQATVLIQGESGTGKELVARAIYRQSPRASAPFIKVNCAAVPDNLIESEFFGHEKGAFTGAVKGKRGLMEVADRGTLFLDEIAEMPVVLQVKLLRALQERQLRRVGGTATIDVDARVVSATNRDLRAAVAKGQFREELYYRVNVIEIPLPPLRDRAGDVRLLAHAFLKRYGGERVRAFEEAALETLEAWAWPGNVRELQNVVERACALADGDRVGRQDLPDYLVQGRGLRAAGAAPAAGAALPAGATADLPLKDAKEKWMQVLEAAYLRDLLERHGGNISAAAKAAGIDRKTFHRLINKYQIRG